MSVNLIVLRDKLTAIYFSLCHDTLSVVVTTIIPRIRSLVNRITNLIKNEVSDKIINVIVTRIRLIVLNPI
jgi:uncharacterized protein with HEPN domain